jgi:hypothetical protein
MKSDPADFPDAVAFGRQGRAHDRAARLTYPEKRAIRAEIG